MDVENKIWLVFMIIGPLILLSTLGTLFLVLRAQHKANCQRRWILENGHTGTANILSIKDTKVRDSEDYYVFEVTLRLIAPRQDTTTHVVRAAVSPLDLHRIGSGENVSVRIHPETGEMALDLPASR